MNIILPAGNTNSVDWSIVFAALSLLISIATLYVAHLRGPKIELVVPDDPYPTRGVSGDDDEITIGLELLIINTGNRPGLLYDVTIALDKNSPLQEHIYGNQEPKGLPRLLPPGGEWRRMYYVTFTYKATPEKLKHFKSHPTAGLTVKYPHSTSFQSKRTARHEVAIRVDDFRKVDAERFDRKTQLAGLPS